MLKPQKLNTANFGSPFDLGAQGFTRVWWQTSMKGRDAFEFRKDGTEVARAVLAPERNFSGYSRSPWYVVEVVKIEVHEDYRGEGIGAEAVAQLIDQYPDQELVAFSAEAPRFWALRAMWFEVPRIDGSERHAPLYTRQLPGRH